VIISFTSTFHPSRLVSNFKQLNVCANTPLLLMYFVEHSLKLRCISCRRLSLLSSNNLFFVCVCLTVYRLQILKMYIYIVFCTNLLVIAHYYCTMNVHLFYLLWASFLSTPSTLRSGRWRGSCAPVTPLNSPLNLRLIIIIQHQFTCLWSPVVFLHKVNYSYVWPNQLS